MARSIIVQPGQCIEDLALQEYGSINGVTWLLLDNEDVFVDGYSTDLPSGSELVLRDEAFDKPVHDAVRKAQVVPATNTDIDGPELGTSGDFSEGDYNNDHFTTT